MLPLQSTASQLGQPGHLQLLCNHALDQVKYRRRNTNANTKCKSNTNSKISLVDTFYLIFWPHFTSRLGDIFPKDILPRLYTMYTMLWTVSSGTGLFWSVLSCIGLYWAILDCTVQCWAVLSILYHFTLFYTHLTRYPREIRNKESWGKISTIFTKVGAKYQWGEMSLRQNVPLPHNSHNHHKVDGKPHVLIYIP